MASYRKRGKTWRAEVRKNGQSVSASFQTKAEAQAWATQKEADIQNGVSANLAPGITAKDVFQRYMKEVSPKKAGYRWEKIRLTSLKKDPLARILLNDLKTIHLARFRDRRLNEVAPATVNRDLNLISGVLSKAGKEWGWLDQSPMQDLERPKNPRPRDRLISQDEIHRIIMVLDYEENQHIRTKNQLVGLYFLLAIKTECV